MEGIHRFLSDAILFWQREVKANKEGVRRVGSRRRSGTSDRETFFRSDRYGVEPADCPMAIDH